MVTCAVCNRDEGKTIMYSQLRLFLVVVFTLLSACSVALLNFCCEEQGKYMYSCANGIFKEHPIICKILFPYNSLFLKLCFFLNSA